MSKNTNHGSWNEGNPDRPKWGPDTRPIADYEYRHADGTHAFIIAKGRNPDGEKCFRTRRKNLMPFGDRIEPEHKVEFFTGMGNELPVLYRLPELIAATKTPETVVLVPEGEKDVETAVDLGFVSTCNPFGALTWRDEFSPFLAGSNVVVIADADADDRGRQHAVQVVRSINGYAKRVSTMTMPSGFKDLTEWKEARQQAGRSKEDIKAELTSLIEEKSSIGDEGVNFSDFQAYMPMHNYIYTPSREPWPASSVNARLGSVLLFNADGSPKLDAKGNQQKIPASTWLDQNKAVEQMTWAPGLPMLIRDRLVSDGGWIKRAKVTCLNLYRPPMTAPGDATKAWPWIKHVFKVFSPADGKHLIRWCAHRVQHPGVKINHAMVIGSTAQGIGKDTTLEPLKYAVGPWNFQEVSPQQLIGRFNGFLKSVVLRVNEARDLGELNRYQFYDHMKAYTASPPDTLRVDEKNLREHSIFNCCGVIISTNHKTNGIYLPPDDRRHYVAWSDRVREDFTEDYWLWIWKWYASGGLQHVAAYLRELDIVAFDPKASPPKTEAFWDIVNANRSPEDAELADILDSLGNPKATTIGEVAVAAKGTSFEDWIKDRKNRRVIPYRFEQCNYVPVRNEQAKSGLWVIGGTRQVIYAKEELSIKDRLEAAADLVKKGPPV